MKVAVKFYQETFSDEVSKEAYLKACRWVATNVVSKVEVGETFWKVERVEDADIPTFKLELYAMLSESELTGSFCDRCKEFHKAFFINEEFNCDRCNMKAYKANVDQKLKVKRDFRKERLNYILKRD